MAAILMSVGVGLFGTFTGFLSSWFMTDKKPNEKISSAGNSDITFNQSSSIKESNNEER